LAEIKRIVSSETKWSSFSSWKKAENASYMNSAIIYVHRNGVMAALDCPLLLYKNCKVLDVGCGEGHLSRIFAEHGYDVTGIEISEVALEWAKSKCVGSKNNINYIHADVSDPGFLLLEKRISLIIYRMPAS